MKILIADVFGPELPGLLAAYGDVYSGDDSVLEEADVLLVRSKTKVRGDYLERARNLKLVIRGGVGVDNIDMQTCAARGIYVRNTPQASAIAVAEMAFALMLSVLRHVPPADAGTRAGEWPKKQLKGSELYGKTLGLIGLGNIANEVAVRAKAFGMTVLGTRRSNKSSACAEVVALEDLLARADVISLHVPATPETRDLVNAGTIAQMKQGAILINTARGACVNSADLVAALESGRLGGAGIDVYEKEPVGEDSPLLSAPRVVLTPHLGASTAENMGRIAETAVRLVADLVEGRLSGTAYLP